MHGNEVSSRIADIHLDLLGFVLRVDAEYEGAGLAQHQRVARYRERKLAGADGNGDADELADRPVLCRTLRQVDMSLESL